MQVKIATHADAEAVSEVLSDLVAAGKRRKASDADFALRHYIVHPAQIRCSLALAEDGVVAGFQSLKLATSDNPYGTPLGWGMIGTHIRPCFARQGVGRLLFTSTLQAAKEAGLPAIEAFIGAENTAGITYYEAMGFTTYRPVDGVDCKMLRIS